MNHYCEVLNEHVFIAAYGLLIYMSCRIMNTIRKMGNMEIRSMNHIPNV